MTRAAGLAGVSGSAAGVVAGLAQATFGDQVPALTGAKASPVGLGVLTIVLSLGALAAAAPLLTRHRVTDGQRAAAVIGLLVVGGVGATTVGLLWILPGTLLLGAAGLLVAADAAGIAAVVSTQWRQLLVGVLGALEVLMALSASPRWVAGVGIVGGIAVVAAPWAPGRLWQRRLLLVGAVPFAVLTWWSVATPLVAVLAVALGWRDRSDRRPVGDDAPRPRRSADDTGDYASLRSASAE